MLPFKRLALQGCILCIAVHGISHATAPVVEREPDYSVPHRVVEYIVFEKDADTPWYERAKTVKPKDCPPDKHWEPAPDGGASFCAPNTGCPTGQRWTQNRGGDWRVYCEPDPDYTPPAPVVPTMRVKRCSSGGSSGGDHSCSYVNVPVPAGVYFGRSGSGGANAGGSYRGSGGVRDSSNKNVRSGGGSDLGGSDIR